ncbi:MAG TPA: CvpA family protein [Nitrosomonas sp.]|nr:CvpA family protein [Nitrosomonas sp.]HQX13389.1 CvpA family protein [Nitrosomonas sp.]HRB20141.1 CvpA family protein [Nitrosomonas sp.]HRB31699.1 CvpA family protein [Nitrosomonas sp.]HRB44461.1 CvpA family protein [Nitrosomonas sp.]
MTVFDYVVCAIFVVSIVLSIIRGLVREVLSIAGWIAAFIVAGAYTSFFVKFLPDAVVGETLRFLVTFVLVFLTVLVNTALLTMLLTALIKNIGLGFIDRLFGSVFGFLRALIIATVIVLMAGLTTIPSQSFWQQAVFSKPLELVAKQVLLWLPEDLAKHISFDKKESY